MTRELDGPFYSIGRKSKPNVLVSIIGGCGSARLKETAVIDTDIELTKERLASIISESPENADDFCIVTVSFARITPVPDIEIPSVERKISLLERIKKFLFS